MFQSSPVNTDPRRFLPGYKDPALMFPSSGPYYYPVYNPDGSLVDLNADGTPVVYDKGYDQNGLPTGYQPPASNTPPLFAGVQNTPTLNTKMMDGPSSSGNGYTLPPAQPPATAGPSTLSGGTGSPSDAVAVGGTNVPTAGAVATSAISEFAHSLPGGADAWTPTGSATARMWAVMLQKGWTIPQVASEMHLPLADVQKLFSVVSATSTTLPPGGIGGISPRTLLLAAAAVGVVLFLRK